MTRLIGWHEANRYERKKHGARGASINLARIGNNRGAIHMTNKAQKLDRIAERCRARLAEDERQRVTKHLTCNCAFFWVKDDLYRCHYCGWVVNHTHGPACNGSFFGVLSCAFSCH